MLIVSQDVFAKLYVGELADSVSDAADLKDEYAAGLHTAGAGGRPTFAPGAVNFRTSLLPRVLPLLELTPKDIIVDLGCGSGQLAVAFAILGGNIHGSLSSVVGVEFSASRYVKYALVAH